MKNLIICGMLICLFSACLEKIDTSKINNTKWELSELPGMTLPANGKATLNFGDSLQVGGKSFCNSYGGKVEVVDNKLAFKNIFGTKMFCEQTDAAERSYLSALNQVNGAKIDNDMLYLLSDNKTLLVFKKTN